MNRKAFLSLAVVTAAAVVFAVVAVMSQPRIEAIDVAGEPVFPGLAEKLDNLRTVVVRHNEGEFTFAYEDGAWRIRERGGYPADGEKIANVVVRMARMNKLESKTSQPDLYERLDLNDPTAEGSRAKQVILKDASDAEIANLIIGKSKFTLGSKEGGTYIRLPSDPQTWLAMGEVAPGNTVRDWIKRDVVDIKDAAINRIIVTHPKGERVSVVRWAEGAFAIENLPKDAEPESPETASEFAQVLAALLVDDVRKAADVEFPKDGTITAEFQGTDFKVILETADIDGKAWIKLRGEAVEKPPVEQAADAPKTLDWAAIIADLNKRTEGWAFQVADYEVAVLKKRMADLVKKPEEKS